MDSSYEKFESFLTPVKIAWFVHRIVAYGLFHRLVQLSYNDAPLKNALNRREIEKTVLASPTVFEDCF